MEELRALGLDGEQRRQQLEERLLHALEQKAGIAEVASELESKAAVADVNAMLDTKASIADVNESLLLKANKASVIAALQKKVSRSEIEVLIGADPDGGDGDGGGVRSLGTFGEQVRTLQLQQAHARAAADSANAKLGRELAAVSADVRAQLSSAQVELDELSARVRELPTASEHRRALGSRVTLDEVRALLDETARRAAVEPSGTAALVRAVHEEVSALKRALENTPTRSELHSALEAKLGAGAAAALAESATAGAAHVQLSAAVAAKADSARVDALAAELEARQAALAAELRAELSAALARAADADALSELSARIGAKADEARVASALEGKASAAELNALLAQVTSRLDSAVAAAAHSASAGPGVHSAAEQALILESLCSEHLLGRWIWKSGRCAASRAPSQQRRLAGWLAGSASAARARGRQAGGRGAHSDGGAARGSAAAAPPRAPAAGQRPRTASCRGTSRTSTRTPRTSAGRRIGAARTEAKVRRAAPAPDARLPRAPTRTLAGHTSRVRRAASTRSPLASTRTASPPCSCS